MAAEEEEPEREKGEGSFQIISAALETLVLLFRGGTVMFQQSIHIDLG